MDLNQNTEEKNSSINNQFGKRKTLYIVNFTPIRLLVFSISAVVLILFIFVLGFHLGGSKPVHAANSSDDSMEALMRGAETSDNMNSEISSADVPNNDIMALNEYENTSSSSIIREGNTSADRYNEYTQNLASELDAINEDIKEQETRGMSPNSTYTPPQQMAVITPSTVPASSSANNSTANTRVPYTRSSSSDSIYFIQVAVGYDKVKAIRRQLETRTGRQSIPVWHRSRGLEEYKNLCREYSYIAIGGIAIKDIKSSEYRYFYKLLNIAAQQGTKVHGLGFTPPSVQDYPFYSVDSSSWTTGSRYATIYQFSNGKILSTRKPEKRLVNYAALDRHNLKQWLKFQHYLDFTGA